RPVRRIALGNGVTALVGHPQVTAAKGQPGWCVKLARAGSNVRGRLRGDYPCAGCGQNEKGQPSWSREIQSAISHRCDSGAPLKLIVVGGAPESHRCEIA